MLCRGGGTEPRHAVYLVGIFPLVIQELLCLNLPGNVIPQPCQHDLPQVGHLSFCRGLHLWVNEEPGIRAHRVHCGENRVRGDSARKKSALRMCHPPKENRHSNSSPAPLTCCGQLPSQAPDFQHGFVAEPVLLTELSGAPRIFTGPHCPWERAHRRS